MFWATAILRYLRLRLFWDDFFVQGRASGVVVHATEMARNVISVDTENNEDFHAGNYISKPVRKKHLCTLLLKHLVALSDSAFYFRGWIIFCKWLMIYLRFHMKMCHV